MCAFGALDGAFGALDGAFSGFGDLDCAFGDFGALDGAFGALDAFGDLDGAFGAPYGRFGNAVKSFWWTTTPASGLAAYAPLEEKQHKFIFIASMLGGLLQT